MDSQEGSGSTFSFDICLPRQNDGPRYGQQNSFEDLSVHCRSPVIITEKVSLQVKWESLMSSFFVQGSKIMRFQQFVSYLEHLGKENKDMTTEHSMIIIDIDLCTIKELGAQPASSKKALDYLRSKFEFLEKIPTLCISDLRLRKTLKSDTPSCTISQQPSPSVQNHDNPSEPQNECNLEPSGTVLQIYKPFKNSKLLSALHQLTNPSDTRFCETTTTNSSTGLSIVAQHPSNKRDSISIESPTHLSQRSRSLSSASSDRPLADFLGEVRSLLVDDNPINRKVLSRMLSRMGLNPQLAQNGREACNLVMTAAQNGQPIQLIFMDIWMPEMNGLEAAATIRQELSSSSVAPYIIAMTACVMPGDREKCIEAGMNGYVSKPVRKEELEAALHTYTQVVMNHSHSEDANSSSEDISTQCESEDYARDNKTHHQHYYKDIPSVTITSES